MASLAARCLRTAAVAAAAARVAARSRNAAPARTLGALSAPRAFSTSTIRRLRKYTRDHEWIDLSADGRTGTIGISEYAAGALGDVVYVELPEEGREVRAGDAIGAVESVKSASDINAPVSCKITHVNQLLEENAKTINRVPEDDSAGGGWLAKVRVADAAAAEIEALMDADQYREFTASEEGGGDDGGGH